MPYCPICGTDHDTDLPCVDKASQVLRRAGIKKTARLPAREFAELSRRARRPVIIYFALLTGAAFLSVLVMWLLR